MFRGCNLCFLPAPIYSPKNKNFKCTSGTKGYIKIHCLRVCQCLIRLSGKSKGMNDILKDVCVGIWIGSEPLYQDRQAKSHILFWFQAVLLLSGKNTIMYSEVNRQADPERAEWFRWQGKMPEFHIVVDRSVFLCINIRVEEYLAE